MNKKNYKVLIWSLFYLLILTILLNQSFNHLDPDLGWHLKVGQDITTEQNVPAMEYYNYTLEGKTWVDHEWLSNALSFILYDKLSYVSLALFFSLLVIIALLLQKHLIAKYITPRKDFFYLLMALQFIGFAASLPHFGIRMQIITFLNLQILLLILENYSTTKKPNRLLWLLPLFYIWSSAHAGFLVGLAVLAFFIFIRSIQYLSSKYYPINNLDLSKTLSLKELGIVSSVSFLSFVSTFLTPYGPKLYEFLKTYSNTFYAKIISEWTPFHYLPIQYKQIFFAAIIASALSLLLICLFGKMRGKPYKVDLWYLSLTLVFIVLAFKSKRHFPLFFIVSLPLAISIFYHYFDMPEKFKRFIYYNKFIWPFFFLSLAILIINFSFKINFTNDPFSSALICKKNPCGAIEHLKQNKEYQDLKIFNNYGWGGYMIWQWPNKKLFIDGRLPQYSFMGHTLLQEYLEFFKEDQAASKLDEHGIELVLLKLNQNIKFNWFEKTVLKLDEEKYNNQKIALKEYLDSSVDWKLIYEDKISNIYVRSNDQ